MDHIWISRCLERRGVEKYFIPASNRMGIALQWLDQASSHTFFRFNNLPSRSVSDNQAP